MTFAQTRTLLDDFPFATGLLEVPAPNETLITCDRSDLAGICQYVAGRGGKLATMTGLDLTPLGEQLAVEFVFSLPAFDEFLRVRASIPVDHHAYPSVTLGLPAAQWYEREVKDLLGVDPVGHPDPRRLVLHETFPAGYHPLRKHVSATAAAPTDTRHFDYFEVQGEGVYELPVGPIHAGIIEPGHFRFSNIGELMLHLDARLFYTHRGLEKVAEGLSFAKALAIAERTCAVCTVSHAVAFSSAVERMAQTAIPARATWLRTLLLELERLYNHIGDLSNICAGAGFHGGTSRGAILKERLQRLNEELTGHRYLMGVVGLGGLRYDLGAEALGRLQQELPPLRNEFDDYIEVLLGASSLVHRMKGPGVLDLETVIAFGGTGVAARASGLNTDYRLDHPYAAYAALGSRRVIEHSGDVYARFMVRSREARESFDLVRKLLDGLPGGPISTELGPIAGGASALGYAESPRGSNVHWLMAGPTGDTVYRLRIRSASYANWPLVTRAVPGNMVPDFPLINKSFELCYSCCDR
jgi:Ni,Fe-hydrogenase III large subunit/Ni,Fe-hydrogenase III component G